MNIFFHSGARLTEITRVQGKDVDLKNQRVKYIIKKGKVIREVYRTIKDIALPFWERALENCSPDQFVFSIGFKPSYHQLSSERATRTWLKWVKKPLGITADLYSLKHANTDEIAAMMGLEVAAKHNAHTVDVARKHYAINENDRLHEKLRKLANSFSPETINLLGKKSFLEKKV